MGRVAVVTGAASGMGLAVARRFAAAGHRVALLDRNGAGAERAAQELEAPDAPTLGLAVDVADRGGVERGLSEVRRQLGAIEILVTSAGLDEFTRFTDISVSQWERMLAVNLTGVFHCVQAAVPDMLAAGWGRIVTISSSSAQSGARHMAHYVASKGGVIALTKALAVELGPHGITVNTVPPGSIETPMTERAQASGNLPSSETLAKMIPVRRVGTPEDVAAACAFLCSDEAGYVNGQQINVNGGRYV
jgi:2-hydroxycyclohexanecarboxyl-CoA dehydrogenase